jgi:hypothetical protein
VKLQYVHQIFRKRRGNETSWAILKLMEKVKYSKIAGTSFFMGTF